MSAATIVSRARSLATDDRALFVVVNVASNLLFLVRSFVTMQVLDYRELGLAALLQSIMLLLAMMQFGILQGGYRLLCSTDGPEATRINNFVYSAMAALSVTAMVVGAVALLFVRGEGYALIGLAGVAGGAATLCKSWMSNQLIARQNLRQLNRATFWSAALSMAMFALVPFDPFLACVLAVIAAPFAFVAIVAFSVPATMPRSWDTSPALARRVLSVGFLMFLTGVFVQANVQIERWYVASALGLPALGRLYLAILFLNIFQLVPISFDAIFLPRLVRAHESGDKPGVTRTMREMFLLTSGYVALAVGATLLLAHPVMTLVLPRYVPDLIYVFWLLPGLALITLTQPFAMIFSVLIRYRAYLVAYGGSTVLTLAAFGSAKLLGTQLTLDEVILVRTAAYVLIAIATVAGFVLVARDAPAFRFGLKGTAR